MVSKNAEKLRGRQGLKGEAGHPGRDVSAADLKKVVETLIEQAISSQPERFLAPQVGTEKIRQFPGQRVTVVRKVSAARKANVVHKVS